MWVDFELISWQTLSDYLPQSPWAVQPSHSCRSSSVLTTDWALFCTPHQEIPVISTSAIAIYYLFIYSPKCDIQYSQKVSQLLLCFLQHSASGTICNINIHHCHLLSVRTAYDTDCVFGQRAFFWDQVFSHTSLTEYAISRSSSPQHHILHNNFLSNLWQFFMQLTQLCALWASARAIQNRRTITAVYIVATKHTITAREYANNDQVNSNITLEHRQCTHNIWPILHKAWFSYINVTITCGICGVWPLSLWLFWTYCNLWVVDL